MWTAQTLLERGPDGLLATVPQAIGGSATTTQFADRVGASVSQHTAVPHMAGLLTSHRHRNTVRHVLARAPSC
ncbi:hypothetical protein GCM10029964_042620 [Kibdelosporangium lantanae]